MLYETRLEERTNTALPGYRGMGPVRVGNSAYFQLQNDNAGSVILSVCQSFVDSRVSIMGTVCVRVCLCWCFTVKW